MILIDKIRLILRKYPECRFNRGEFMYKYIQTFIGTGQINKDRFIEFWKVEAGLERQLRNVLREPEFINIEQDSRRYEKSAQFQQSYRKEETPEEICKKYLLRNSKNN